MAGEGRGEARPSEAGGRRAAREPRSAAGAPEGVATALSRILSGIDLAPAALSAEIARRWEEIVGPEVAAHCRPVGLKGEVLHAEVESSVWCQQLQLRTPEILVALRGAVGDSAPTALRLRVGYNRRP
jgi:predicted nucleic acid-binding Zn ribbon protein